MLLGEHETEAVSERDRDRKVTEGLCDECFRVRTDDELNYKRDGSPSQRQDRGEICSERLEQKDREDPADSEDWQSQVERVRCLGEFLTTASPTALRILWTRMAVLAQPTTKRLDAADAVLRPGGGEPLAFVAVDYRLPPTSLQTRSGWPSKGVATIGRAWHCPPRIRVDGSFGP